MNFQDLLAKMKSIDETIAPDTSVSAEPVELPGGDEPLMGAQEVEECGLPGMSNMPSGMMGMSNQQDSVSMNVSMNAQGQGGIRSLMDVLKNIEQANDAPSDDGEVVIGMEEVDDGGFGDATTRPDVEVSDVDAVVAHGTDLHSQGGGALKHNGGENPMHETLVQKLSAHYASIKEQQ